MSAKVCHQVNLQQGFGGGRVESGERHVQVDVELVATFRRLAHADFGAGFGVAHRAPVGNDETVETVFVAQDVDDFLLRQA